MMAFRDWEKFTGKRFADLAAIRQPTLVVNGIHDEMIPISNSYRLAVKFAQRGLDGVSRLWTWLPVPISRVVHATSEGIPRFQLTVRSLLKTCRAELSAFADNSAILLM